MYKELEKINKKKAIDKYSNLICKIISIIVEYLIEGDQISEDIFDRFCEHNFMSQFVQVVQSTNSEDILLEIVKSMSLLIINLKNQRSLYYIFSNNFINTIISKNILSFNDEFFSYYVNFLKSLAMKIDTVTIQFFFHHNINSFPLIESAFKLYNHPDAMIRNVVRNVFLTICKLGYPPFFDYLCSLPSVTYFAFTACRLREMIMKMDKEPNLEKFKSFHEDIVDDIQYLQDIYSLNIPKINYVLTNALMYYCILPLVLHSVQSQNSKISINLGCYMMCVLMEFIMDESFTNIFFALNFLPLRTKSITKFINTLPINAKNYYFSFENQRKQTINSFHEYIVVNFSPNFLRSIIFGKDSVYTEIRDLAMKYEHLCEANEFNINTQDFLKNMTKDVLSFFSNSELNIMTMYHKQLSMATGVNCGMSTTDTKFCVNKKVEKLFMKFFEIHGGEKSKLVKNDTLINLISFLKCKDDTLILITNLLFNIALKKASKISAVLMRECGLLPAEMLGESDIKKMTIENNPLSKSLTLSSNITSIDKINLEEVDQNNNNSRLSLETKPKKLKMEKIKVSLNDFVEKGTVNDINIFQKEKDDINTSAIKFSKFDEEYFDRVSEESKKFGVAYQYNQELINSLLELLSPYAPFRSITIYIILENIKILGFKGRQCILSTEHKNKIKDIFSIFLVEIVSLINKHSTISEKAFSVLLSKFQSYSEKFDTSLLLKNCELVLPYEYNEVNYKGYPSYLMKVNQDSLGEIFEFLVYTFYYLNDLVNMIDNKEELTKFPIEMEELELNKQYNILQMGKGVEHYECKIKVGMGDNESEDSLLLILGNRLYIGCLSSNPIYTRIKKKYLLSDCDLQYDRGEPRVLNIIIWNNKKKRDFIALFVMFKDVEGMMTAKKNIEENKKSCKVLEKAQILSYFESFNC